MNQKNNGKYGLHKIKSEVEEIEPPKQGKTDRFDFKRREKKLRSTAQIKLKNNKKFDSSNRRNEVKQIGEN